MIKIYRYYDSDLKFNRNEAMIKSWEKNYSKKIYEFMNNSENNNRKDLKPVVTRNGTTLLAIKDLKLFDIPFSLDGITQEDVYTGTKEMLKCVRDVSLRYKGIAVSKENYSFELYNIKRMYSWICNQYSHIIYSTIHVIFNTWLSSIYGVSLTNAAYVTGKIYDLNYFVLLPAYVAAIYNSDWGFSDKNNRLMTLSKFIYIAKEKVEYAWVGILTTLKQYATYFEWDVDNIDAVEINKRYYDNILSGTNHIISASKEDIMKVFKSFIIYVDRYNKNRNIVLSPIRNDIKSNKMIKFITEEQNSSITGVYNRKAKSPSSYAVYMDSLENKSDYEKIDCTITIENSDTYKDVIAKTYGEGQKIFYNYSVNYKINATSKLPNADKSEKPVTDSIKEEDAPDDILEGAHEDIAENASKEDSGCDMYDSEYIDFLEKKVIKLTSELKALTDDNASLRRDKAHLTDTIRGIISDFSKNAKRYYYCMFGDKDVDAVLKSYTNNTIVSENDNDAAGSNGG